MLAWAGIAFNLSGLPRGALGRVSRRDGQLLRRMGVMSFAGKLTSSTLTNPKKVRCCQFCRSASSGSQSCCLAIPALVAVFAHHQLICRSQAGIFRHRLAGRQGAVHPPPACTRAGHHKRHGPHSRPLHLGRPLCAVVRARSRTATGQRHADSQPPSGRPAGRRRGTHAACMDGGVQAGQCGAVCLCRRADFCCARPCQDDVHPLGAPRLLRCAATRVPVDRGAHRPFKGRWKRPPCWAVSTEQ